MRETLYKSIKKGKAKFVEFLLKYGINLKDFLGKDMETLKRLYERVYMPFTCLHQHLPGDPKKTSRARSQIFS